MPLGSNTVNNAAMPGDGIGTEVTEATLAVLEPCRSVTAWAFRRKRSPPAPSTTA
jgi:isocitrate/isopropylmalate dehydrogenase